jgi:hypothetical protein
MAEQLNQKYPGRVQWDICGTGPDFDELKARRDQRNLSNINLLGWVSLETLQQVYSRNHVSIVPTRSDFAEGLAMTAAEAILAGRPLITNPTVPALELLRPASLEGRTNDATSYVTVISKLLSEPGLYKELCQQCQPLQHQFYDRKNGLTEVLLTALSSI